MGSAMQGLATLGRLQGPTVACIKGHARHSGQMVVLPKSCTVMCSDFLPHESRGAGRTTEAAYERQPAQCITRQVLPRLRTEGHIPGGARLVSNVGSASKVQPDSLFALCVNIHLKTEGLVPSVAYPWCSKATACLCLCTSLLGAWVQGRAWAHGCMGDRPTPVPPVALQDAHHPACGLLACPWLAPRSCGHRQGGVSCVLKMVPWRNLWM